MKKFLNDEQKEALALYQERYGNYDGGWKARLADVWRTGRDVNSLTDGQGYLLRQIRNQFGPTWLAAYEDNRA